MLTRMRRFWVSPLTGWFALLWRCLVIGVGTLIPFNAKSEANAPNTNSVDLTSLPLEALMNLDVPKVFAASKVEQKATEAPASVTVVSSDDIKKHGYRTLAALLQSVEGFNISSDRNYEYASTRGIGIGDSNNRLLLLVDGHRVNNNLTDGAAIGNDFILDLDLVSQVEVIHGAGSVLYGNNAFFGVINVVTRKASDIHGVETSFEYGAFETYKGRVTIGKQFTNNLSLLLSGSISDSRGEKNIYFPDFNSAAQNNGVAHNVDGESYKSVFATLGYNDFSLEGAFNHREKVNPTAEFNLITFNDPRFRTKDDRGYLALKYAHNFPEIMEVTAQVYADSYEHYIGSPQSLVVGTNVLFSDFTADTNKGQWWGAELQLNRTFLDKYAITIGTEYRNDFLQQDAVSGQSTVNRSRLSYGLYAQGDFALRKNLHLSSGVRFDKYGDFKYSVNPRVALIYNPFQGSTVKAIYGTAFRTPNFEELSNPAFQNITPETIRSYELSYEQEVGKHIRFSLTGYYNEVKNLIAFYSGNFNNIDAQTKGLEIAVEGAWNHGVRGRASYSLIKTHDNIDTLDIPDSPNHLLKFSLSAPIYQDKLFAGLELLFTSQRRTFQDTSDASGQPITLQGSEIGGYGIINFTLYSQHIAKNLEVSAGIYNLLDAKFSDPATHVSQFHVENAIPGIGRSFRIKASYRF